MKIIDSWDFYMNGTIKYTIKEVAQEELMEYKADKSDGFYFGQTHFFNQEIWIDKSLSKEKKKKTLYHELMHVYIKEFLTTQDIESFDEEILCDISANSHDLIHEIVEYYMEDKYSEKIINE